MQAAFGFGGLSLAGFAFFRYFYRRIIRDSLEVAKDKGETELVNHLIAEQKLLTDANNQLRDMNATLSKERAETLSKLGRLEADADYAKERLYAAQQEIALLRRQLGIALTDQRPS